MADLDKTFHPVHREITPSCSPRRLLTCMYNHSPLKCDWSVLAWRPMGFKQKPECFKCRNLRQERRWGRRFTTTTKSLCRCRCNRVVVHQNFFSKWNGTDLSPRPFPVAILPWRNLAFLCLTPFSLSHLVLHNKPTWHTRALPWSYSFPWNKSIQKLRNPFLCEWAVMTFATGITPHILDLVVCACQGKCKNGSFMQQQATIGADDLRRTQVQDGADTKERIM